ncbi:hypothetical protein ACGFJT_41775 [Actinomadura geliboluensis]|uniref:hypothetical protein n=1 Tax=Actinomadura geliboluensis TaxID=882440 RepID=UPI0037208C37
MMDRPIGRDAIPGELEGPPNPQWLACRRCGSDCGRAGHPHGCPRTPGYTLIAGLALRPCYCGQTIVAAPGWVGACCADTPPVRVPGGCVGCGDDTCRICNPGDQPEAARWLGGGWWHARCLDAQFPAEEAARRQAQRRAPLGVIDAR